MFFDGHNNINIYRYRYLFHHKDIGVIAFATVVYCAQICALNRNFILPMFSNVIFHIWHVLTDFCVWWLVFSPIFRMKEMQLAYIIDRFISNFLFLPHIRIHGRILKPKKKLGNTCPPSNH